MIEGIPQSDDDFKMHLAEQLRFLETSCDSYDSGNDSEAKRLATTLRLLLHDTPSSKSLLGQLGMKERPFWNSALQNIDGNVYTFSALTAMHSGPEGSKYVAHLDDVKGARASDFNSWWGEVIFIDKDQSTITRRELVLSIANKDGGSHIDPVLDEKYAKLSRKGSLNWIEHTPTGGTPLRPPERAAIRQIAHEVLKTLRPEYQKKSQVPGIRIAGVSFVPGNIVQPPLLRELKVGRNEPCTCGSGKKYKKCHGGPTNPTNR
jgi:hypothetical protein